MYYCIEERAIEMNIKEKRTIEHSLLIAEPREGRADMLPRRYVLATAATFATSTVSSGNPTILCSPHQGEIHPT